MSRFPRPENIVRVAMSVILAALLVVATGSPALAWSEEQGQEQGQDGHAAKEHGHDKIGDPPKHSDARKVIALPPGARERDLAFFSGIVFLIVLLVLWRFAWGPIRKALDEREQRIAENIAAAQRQHDEARLLLAQYEKKLESASGEVRAIMEEARRDAEYTQQEIIAKAREEAQRQRDRAIREIDLATQAALKELGEKSVDLAVELAGKIVAAHLSPEEHTRMVQEAVARFGQPEPSRN